MTSGETNHRERLDYMNLYRGFTILCIVFVHSLTRFLDHSLWYYDLLSQLLGESTCLFCFISGFFYEYIGYDTLTYKQFVIKKIRRLILPYLFWSFAFIIWECIWRYGCLDIKWMVWVFVSGLTQFNGVHWYIQLIFAIFLIIPLLREALNVRYFGEILTIIAIFLSLVTGRDVPEHIYYGIATIPHLIGFFMLGMFCSKNRVRFTKAGKYWYFPVIVGSFICAIHTIYASTIPEPETTLVALRNITNGVTLNWLTLNKLFFAIGLLLMFFQIGLKKPRLKFLDILAKYSFPIYFCHLYFYIPWIITGRDSHGGILTFVIGSLYLITASLTLCYLLGKTKYVSRYIGI